MSMNTQRTREEVPLISTFQAALPLNFHKKYFILLSQGKVIQFLFQASALFPLLPRIL